MSAIVSSITSPSNFSRIFYSSRDLATNWITTDEIAAQLNLFGDESQDGYLESLELATRMAVEDYLGAPVFTTTLVAFYPISSASLAPAAFGLPQVSQSGTSIDSVKYYNSASPPVLTTLASSTYFYDITGAQLVLNTVPSDCNTKMAAPLQITWTNQGSIVAQYPVVKQAALLMLTHLYNNRADTTERKLHTIPSGVCALLRPYKPLVM
jgi:hypothetical protein